MRRHLEVEADELVSFVQRKANKPWIWIALDAKTRHVLALHIGEGTAAGSVPSRCGTRFL
jgi:IS1 family transposase